MKAGNKSRSVIFVSGTPYPNGLAATNRIVSLLSELPLYSWKVDVVCLNATKYPTEIINGENFFNRKGIFKGVNFRYISASVKADNLKLIRTLSAFWGIISLPFILRFSFDSNIKGKIFLTNLTQAHYVVYFKIVSQLFNYKLVLIRSEYPRIIMGNSRLKNLYKIFIERWLFRLFNGFVLMTFTLRDYFLPLIRKDALLTIIPMTVNIDRFSGKTYSPFDFKYIAYAGSLSNLKDGVDILIHSFISIAEKHPTVHLVIIGDKSDNSLLNYLNNIVSKANETTKSRVHFIGHIDSSQIPEYLCNASLLALARPDSTQAQGGFPTKLGEYLATGKPVVVTKVGEIPDFLTQRKDAILCVPGDIVSFAENLDWALNNYQEAMSIGKAGRSVAEITFNSKVQGKEFSNFLEHFLCEDTRL